MFLKGLDRKRQVKNLNLKVKLLSLKVSHVLTDFSCHLQLIDIQSRTRAVKTLLVRLLILYFDIFLRMAGQRLLQLVRRGIMRL